MNGQSVAGPQYFTYYPGQQHYHDPAYASVAYRSLQSQLQHQAAAEQHLRQQQLSLAAASNAVHRSNFRHQQQLPVRTRQQAHPARIMANYQQHGMTEDEWSEFQKLSNEYQPEAKVGIWSLKFCLFVTFDFRHEAMALER